MDSHQRANIGLDDLLVNPDNYRFSEVANQQEAMLKMLQTQNDKIIKLARDIAQHGLNPTRILLVRAYENSKYVVIEGNRRMTALKLMTNPDEIPGDYPSKSTFKELYAKYKGSLPTTVECIIYPEDQRDVADSWVLLEHTGENQGVGTVPWTTVQKQRFEARHKKIELSRPLQLLEFLETKGIDVSGIEATNLERLISTPAVREKIGIDFTNKQLILTGTEQDVLQKLKKVVKHMGSKDFTVRQIYHARQRLEWIDGALGLKPSTPNPSKSIETLPQISPSNGANPPNPQTNSPSPVSDSSLSPNMPQQPAKNGSTNAPPSTSSEASTSRSSALPPSGSSGTSMPPQPLPPLYTGNAYQTLINPAKTLSANSPEKIVEIYKELQTVNISGTKQAPHAVGALLRILVEITAQEYLMNKRSFSYDRYNHFRNSTEPNKAYDELKEKLSYIANQCGLPGNIAQLLRTLLADQLLTATLNQLMHSTLFTASGIAIKELWRNFEKVFDYLINEIQ